MQLGFMFVSMCAVFLMLQSVRAVAGGDTARRVRWARVGSAFHAASRISGRRRLHWVDTAELSCLMASDPELVIFRLVEGDSKQDWKQRNPNDISVTLNELEKTLAWIPHSSRIALYRAGGLNASLVRRLSAIMGGRDVLLLQGEVPIRTAGNSRNMAGELCS